MSQDEKRHIKKVLPIAEKLVAALTPYCDKIEIAGSLRRKRNWIGDIEIVALPKVKTAKNLLGEVVSRVSLLAKRLDDLVDEGKLVKGHAWGEKYRKAIVTTNKGETYSVDIFMATERNFGNIMAIRTGSRDFSTYLVSHIRAQGMRQDKGLLYGRDNQVINCPTEKGYFEAIGHTWIDPTFRDDGKWHRLQWWREGKVTNALSIKQPWLHAIESLGKAVENRTWKPPQKHIGRRMALHASGEPDKPALESLGVFRDECTYGAITSTALLVGWVYRENEDSSTVIRHGDHPAVQSFDFDNQWYYEGQFGWIFTDVQKLEEPVFTRGALGVWFLLGEQVEAVNHV